MRSIKLVIALAALSLAAAAAAQADGWGPATPNFNLEAILQPAGADGGFGHVKFRQPKDDAKIIYLDTWVRDLAPNHTYFLQRAVDLTVDDDCSDAVGWATLGEIRTDDDGTGRAALSRNVSAIPTGMEFDIHFRVVTGAAASATALESACYQYVVSQ
jgi:hypothetical protein